MIEITSLFRRSIYTMRFLFLFALLVPFTTFAETRLLDLKGNIHASFDPTDNATVLVFLGAECPISRKYIPTLNDLAKEWADNKVKVLGVLSDPLLSRAKANAFAAEFKIGFPVLFDSSLDLARELRPSVMPEAFVLSSSGEVVYSGRIDDGYAALGKPKANITSRDLENAVESVLKGQPVKTKKTTAIGCKFEALNAPKPIETKLTYTRDIAPLVIANCVQCHRDGEAAPFPLLTYEDVSKRAKLIAEVTESRYMPPWKPVANYGKFQHERTLTNEQIATLKAWADAGAPQGDPKELPPVPKFPSDWYLGTPDKVVKMTEPFTIPAKGRDIYRAFVVPTEIPEDMYLSAFEFRADAKSVVHHVIFYLDDSGKARELDAKDSGPGYKSFGGPGFLPRGGSLGGWVPGNVPQFYPDGIGKPIAKNSDLIFQMHYHPDGTERKDQSSVALYFSKKPVDKIVINFPIATRDINIPPGEKNYVRRASITAPSDVTIMGLLPHMHLIGRKMTVTATTPDGKTIPMIKIDDWDFRWQDQYRFAEPLTLPKGTVVNMEAVYDNSADNPSNPNTPPKVVKHGEQTTDEMCMCFLQVIVDQKTMAMTEQRREALRNLLRNSRNRNGQ